MKILNQHSKKFQDEFQTLLNQGSKENENITNIVNDILTRVKNDGEKAIFEDIEKFDHWSPTSVDELYVDRKDMKKAYDNLDANLKKALHKAYDRIESYHKKQLQKSWIDYEENGTMTGIKITPLQRAGLYIPGGKASYPSSLLMNAIAAKVAGVKEIIVTTPTPDGNINELLLAGCFLCGVKDVLKIGGATAIGVLAYGTKDIKKVDIITGPGNIFVATAKRLVYGQVQIDMIAGPSEIGIIADSYANTDYLAMDMLSQAEHDEMARSILITTDENIATATQLQIEKELKNLQREKIARSSIENYGCIIVVKTIDDAISLMNEIAVEHLEVMTSNPFELLPKIKNAGAIFLGENTPEPIGDYIAGPNHTLPTAGTAKFYSALSVDNFIKKSSIIYFSKQAISELGHDTMVLAQCEGLEAHKKAVELRL
ncbi:MAG: histidinol dehydrogenase [Campylobacteraceae bacterium 4484_166]|nr:MAG: histidinol dehydrogenase [Campylobacteraceae bacterium 4484_166]